MKSRFLFGRSFSYIDLDYELAMDDESYPVIEAFVGIGNHHLGILADILEGRVLATGMS